MCVWCLLAVVSLAVLPCVFLARTPPGVVKTVGNKDVKRVVSNMSDVRPCFIDLFETNSSKLPSPHHSQRLRGNEHRRFADLCVQVHLLCALLSVREMHELAPHNPGLLRLPPRPTVLPKRTNGVSRQPQKQDLSISAYGCASREQVRQPVARRQAKPRSLQIVSAANVPLSAAVVSPPSTWLWKSGSASSPSGFVLSNFGSRA